MLQSEKSPHETGVNRNGLTLRGDVCLDPERACPFREHVESAADQEVDAQHPVEPWDTQYIIFTSGTTGPSKAVLSSYIQTYAMGPESFRFITGEDRFLVNLPLFHVGGTMYVYFMLVRGGSCLVVRN